MGSNFVHLQVNSQLAQGTCWKGYFFSPCMALGHCGEATDHRYLDLFLESQFYCMDLYVYLAIISTLFWLLSIVISFESGRCDSLQPFFSYEFVIFWASWISTWTLVVNFLVLQEKAFNVLMGILLNVDQCGEYSYLNNILWIHELKMFFNLFRSFLSFNNAL